MKIEWNKVTWYSKTLALFLLIALPFLGFYLGSTYQSSISPTSQTANINSYQNSCKSGEVALFEGGIFSSCQKPATSSSNLKSSQKINQTKTNSSTSSSTGSNQNSYPNPCNAGQVALYEGGIFSGCSIPAGSN